ncbi:MAG: type II toxin-antitoxin system VapC family toxin [Candidatus Eremiobacterota bacterium]
MVLLDTCTLLWLSDPTAALPESVREEIRRHPPSARFVSAISAFEIGHKHAHGRLSLPLPAPVWFGESCAQRGIQPVPISASIAMRASQLPRHHRDPADRFIISTAMEYGLKVLTPDGCFKAYDIEVSW